VKYLLDVGSDINRKSKSGETPLHLAVMRNHSDVVKCLLLRGADYNLTNFHKIGGTHTVRNTPRDVAVEEHLPDIVKIFDNFKIFEKKREKETKELELFVEEQKKKEILFEDSQNLSLIEFKNSKETSVTSIDNFNRSLQEEKSIFYNSKNEELLQFYKTHKTLKPPNNLIPEKNSSEDSQPTSDSVVTK